MNEHTLNAELQCLGITTTTVAKIRGFTLELLFHLEDGPKRCVDLAKITGKYSSYVHSYLRNMKKYGFVEKEGSFWHLTASGSSFVSYLDSIHTYIHTYIIRKKKKERKKERKKNQKRREPKKQQQISIQLFQQNSGLHDIERRVVEDLLRHYNETGSKFILVRDKFELSERLKMNPQTVGEALKNLVQDNVIYVYRMKSEGLTKIGLKKAWLAALELKNNE